MRRLANSGRVSQALALCEAVFSQRPDLLDAHRHPIYFKESLRFNLLLGDVATAQSFAGRLQPLLRPNDAAVQILLARHHVAAADHDAARVAWRAALARDPNCAEAREWLTLDARDSMSSGIGGLAELTWSDCADLSRFGDEPGDVRLHLFPPLSQPAGLPLAYEAMLPEQVRRDYHARDPAPGGIVHAVGDCVLTGISVLVRGDRVVLPEDVLPDYFVRPLTRRPHALEGSRFGALGTEGSECLRLDVPVATAVHGYPIWGHFLFEMLPRLWLLGVLARLGRAFPLLLPTNAPPWLTAIATGIVGAERIIGYDPIRQYVAAPRFIVPTMMQRDWRLHPAFNLLAADLHARFALPDRDDTPRRIYLSRVRHDGARRLLNEEAVEETLAAMGFAIVHLQTMSFAEQLLLWRNCDVVVSECNSALHGALFAPAGTRVVALNCYDYLQASIARTRGQRVWFIPPEDGAWRDASGGGDRRNFSVDCERLRRTVHAVLDGAP